MGLADTTPRPYHTVRAKTSTFSDWATAWRTSRLRNGSESKLK